MLLIGRLFSVFAALSYRKEWRDLNRILRELRRETPIVPNVAQQMLILGEDHRFFSHRGVDLMAIFRVIWRRVVYGKIEGGSTLEQQMVRVLTSRYEKTLRRKVREICLATLIARSIDKREIPALYLTVAYFGWRMNGFKNACAHLGFRLDNFGVQEAAHIVALIKYPQPQRMTHGHARLIHRRRLHLLNLYNGNLTVRQSEPILESIHETF